MLPLLCIELWLNLNYFYYTDCLHKSIHYLLRGKACAYIFLRVHMHTLLNHGLIHCYIV